MLFIDSILFKFLSDRVLFKSSVIGYSSSSAIIDSSLGSSILFFHHVTMFYELVLLFCFIFIIFSKTTGLTSAKLIAKESMKKYLHDKDTKYHIEKYVIKYNNI